MKDVCDGILKIAQDKKREFRLIFQVATSPQYGDKIREFAKHLEHVYIRYTQQLSKEFNVSFDELYLPKSLVYKSNYIQLYSF